MSEPPMDRFEQVLELYTTRRMKPTFQHLPEHKRKLGVSIPSQQRWLRYWSQSLATDGSMSSSAGGSLTPHKRSCKKVKVSRVVVRMRELSGIQPSLVHAMSVVQQATNLRSSEAASGGHVWASLARYDDDLVEGLSELSPCQTETPRILKDGRWDREKMVRKFATMSTGDVEVSGDGNMGALLYSFSLVSPLDECWVDISAQDHMLVICSKAVPLWHHLWIACRIPSFIHHHIQGMRMIAVESSSTRTGNYDLKYFGDRQRSAGSGLSRRFISLLMWHLPRWCLRVPRSTLPWGWESH